MSDYSFEHLNFLIVDDNQHMRTLVRTIIYALGSKRVMEAGDGADGFKALRQFPADIIICDWNMSPLDGLDFLRLLRNAEDSPNPYVPVIMMTGHTERQHVLQARDAGVHEFLAKPISARSLYLHIRSVIERPARFVRCQGYFGPDRRRRQLDIAGKNRRLICPRPARPAETDLQLQLG